MNVTQQYLLDTYRAGQHGEPAPPRPRPAPGTHAWCASCASTAGSAPSWRDSRLTAAYGSP